MQNGGTTPTFIPPQVLYGRTPPNYLVANLGLANLGLGSTKEVQEWGKEREKIIRDLRENLLKTQNRMKQFADRHRVDREFKVGDFGVPKATTLPTKHSDGAKEHEAFSLILWALRGFGEGRGGGVQVAASGRLKDTSRLLCFLAQVKPTRWALGLNGGTSSVEEGQPPTVPEKILDRRMVRRGNKAVAQVLVK